MGRAKHRRGLIIPILITGPIARVELVLYVEEPDPGRSGDPRNNQLHKKICADAKEQRPYDSHRDDEKIGYGNASLDLGGGVASWQATLEHKKIDRTQYEQDKGISTQTIVKSFESRCPLILFEGHGEDIANAPVVELTARCVMYQVPSAPLLKRHKTEGAGNVADDLVRTRGWRKVSVGAVVAKNKYAYQEKCDGYRSEHDPDWWYASACGEHQSRYKREIG